MAAFPPCPVGLKPTPANGFLNPTSGAKLLNYSHAFHAGNFADLLKHSLLLAVVGRLKAEGPLTVLETHAGAGCYDLGGDAARRSGEAQAGVARLMSTPVRPPTLEALAGSVRSCNPDGELRWYPGSPWLAAQALGPTDIYVGCELQADAYVALEAVLAPRKNGPCIELVQGDGYALAARRLSSTAGRTLLMIDPPFERADDYARTAELIAARPDPARQPALVWTPLKDLETFDAFLGALEGTGPASLVSAQARLRPLDDPMRMNGCAVVLVDAPDVTAEAQTVCDWLVAHLGAPGASGRVERLGGAQPAS